MSHLEDGALPSTRDGVHETADLPMPPPVPAGLPADLAALDRFSAKPQDLPAWEAARDAMGSADNDDPLPAARDALMMAVDVPERERARQELAGLLDELRPLPMPAHFRPASDIADPLPRPVLRAAGQGGALLCSMPPAVRAPPGGYGAELHRACIRPERGGVHRWTTAPVRPAHGLGTGDAQIVGHP